MSPAAIADPLIPAPGENELKIESALSIKSLSAVSPATPYAGNLSSPSSLVTTSQSPRNLPPDDDYLPVGILRKHEATDGQSTETPNFPVAELGMLERQGWIKLRWHAYESRPGWSYVQIFVLPHDVGRNLVPRTSNTSKKALKLIMASIDRSPTAFNGEEFAPVSSEQETDAAEDESLWYIFNTLENPDPVIEQVRDGDGRLAMEELMYSSRTHDATVRESSGVVGLKTPLHPYQCRSAATMIQREVHPKQMLDPRLQTYTTPYGDEYYYDKEEGTLLREKRLYSEACGGILAETMGCGKTLICLSVILATRGHCPRIPIEYQDTTTTVRRTTGSLMEMAAAAAGRYSVPWQSYFRLLKESGMNYERCVQACERNRGHYTIPPPPSRYQSRGGWLARPPAVTLYLHPGTLIIVPANLVDHWASEIATHTEGLRVLILRNRNDKTPPADELSQYDIILFSRTRFEKEAGEPETSRSPSQSSESPLKEFHWLRIIVDEGHNVAGHGHKSSTMHMLDQLHIERRWVVSGTPSNGLYGAELSLASQQTMTTDSESTEDATSSVLYSRKKTGTRAEEELKDVDKLRLIVVEFLKHKPWANSRADDPANWTKYIKPIGENGKRRKSPSLRAVLQGLVVRHQLDVINNELPLPRLFNKVVALEPTFYDKLSLNLFLLILTVNAVTSERTDQDYMFQSRNRKHLTLLINNLRQAGFWWTGHKEKAIQTTLDVATNYLEKNREKMTSDDIELLSEGIAIAHRALSCKSYCAFSNFDELGVYVQGFPKHGRRFWSLVPTLGDTQEMLLGISQGRRAQSFVASNLLAEDPSEGLAGVGITTRQELSQRSSKSTKNADESGAADTLTPKNKPAETRPRKTFLKGIRVALPSESPLSATKLIATTSAKLTYLLDRVQELQKKEKIIIFYENNNTAFWIAEGLEMLGLEFRIYANTLKASQKAAYLSLFEESSSVRILLMDLRQASHGLHVASASRVFIVNPIWRPNVESQAIKRAHRIGQTRPVFVETLVLKDTLEEKMLHRRKEMSSSEMQHAEKDMLEDSTMSSIIQRERFYPLPENDDFIQPAYLQEPSGFFDRHDMPVPDEYAAEVVSPASYPVTPTKRRPAQTWPDYPIIESDISPEHTPKKKKKTVPRFQVVGENGVIMAPPRSRGSRSPEASGLLSPEKTPRTPSGNNDSSSLDRGPSLFGS